MAGGRAGGQDGSHDDIRQPLGALEYGAPVSGGCARTGPRCCCRWSRSAHLLGHGLQPDGPIRCAWPVLLIIAAMLLAVLAPRASAKIAPFALLAYGAYGLYLAHLLLVNSADQVYYGPVHVSGDSGSSRLQRLGVRSSERSGSTRAGDAVIWRASLDNGQRIRYSRRRWPSWPPGSGCSRGRARRAAARCAGPWRSCAGRAASRGRCRRCCCSPVLFLWEELFGQHLWFGTPGQSRLPADWRW